MVQWAARESMSLKRCWFQRGITEGLPVRLPADKAVFLSRRFDRPEKGGRIHQEDFAQVMNLDVRSATAG